jgi:hypothetical protein
MQETLTHSETIEETQEEKEQLAQDTEELHKFYKVRLKKGKIDGIEFKMIELINIFRQFGIYRYDVDEDTIKFIRVNEKRIKLASETKIQDEYFKYLDTLPDYEITVQQEDGDGEMTEAQIKITPNFIKEASLKRIDNLFKTKLLYRLSLNEDLTIQGDEKGCKYLYYQNGYIKVTVDKVTFNEYSRLNNYIWENSILPRNFEKSDRKKSTFELFARNICIVHNTDGSENKEETDKRFLSLKTIIGYNLHNYTKGKMFATLFTDSRMDEDGEPNGRTGKTLLVKGLGHILNANDDSAVFTEISGKNFDITQNTRYQACNLETQLVHLNDVYRNFNIENIFNDITEGIEARKLYESPVKIHPKIILSSNRTIKVEGESAKDRTIVFELSEHYNSEYSPVNEFGHWFFEDWDKAEWARFDGFMINCLQSYFTNGVIRADSINLDRRMLIDHTHRDFVRWLDYRFKDIDDEGNKIENTLRINKVGYNEMFYDRYDKKQLFADCITENPDFSRWKTFTQRKFTIWLKTYIRLMHLGRVTVKEVRSNGIDYISFHHTK